MKYVALINYLFSYIKNSFFSIFSFIVLKLISKRNILELTATLKNKKVLVLGTGPSLDQINQKIIDNYEVIIFLNKSINVIKIFDFKNKTKIFFNSDLYMFNQIKKNIHSFNEKWLFVFIPIHLQLFLSLLPFYFKKKVFLLIPKYRMGLPFEKNVTKSIITYNLISNHNIKNILSIDDFRPFPYTVALNAFYFLILSKVEQLHYLGCDFTLGRSVFTKYSVQSDLPEKNKKVNLWLNKLKKLAIYNSIDFKDLK